VITPFFSILIPTRGRPDLLRDALVSALFQDFDDFEVVVSDNYNDDRTQKVLDEFRHHGRLKCIRSNHLLPMPQHWEFVSQHAEGTYVLFLTDRSILKRHALKTIYNAINATDGDVPVCSWRWSLYDDVARREFGDAPIRAGAGTTMLASRLVAADFAKGSRQYPYSLPRGLNSCYRNGLVKSLRDRFGTVFKPISPDFTSAFLLLANVNDVLFIDQALFISQGLSLSNGGDAYTKTATAYLESLGDQDWFTQVPIKAPLVENVIFQDYFAIQGLAGGVLSQVNIDWAVYFEACYRELIEKTGANLLSAQSLDGLYSEWTRALGEFDGSVQDEVQRRLQDLRWVQLRARLKGSALGPLLRSMKRTVNTFRHRGWHIKGKQTVLEAAGFRGKEE